MVVLCLDTYPLVEIAKGNQKFGHLLEQDFIITEITMAEFYYVILQGYNAATADFWYRKLQHYCVQVPKETLIKGVNFRFENRTKNFSFFDSVGYVFSVEHHHTFVTGDKEFEAMKGVMYLIG